MAQSLSGDGTRGCRPILRPLGLVAITRGAKEATKVRSHLIHLMRVERVSQLPQDYQSSINNKAKSLEYALFYVKVQRGH